MKRFINPKDYKAWYQIWRQDTKQHMGNHFCEHFKIDNEELKTTDNWWVSFNMMNNYLICEWGK